MIGGAGDQHNLRDGAGGQRHLKENGMVEEGGGRYSQHCFKNGGVGGGYCRSCSFIGH